MENNKDMLINETVDFAVTARKYKTLLTAKYKARKPWIEPNLNLIVSGIPGTVIEILAKEGDEVKEGDTVLILEAMKMLNRIKMPFDAKIKKIEVAVGAKIPKETVLIELEEV